mgnify:FL=1
MKPKLIIGAGVGWSATRSLMFSLSNYNHGLGKEDHILYQLSINDPKHLKFYTESKETRERNKRYGYEETPTLDRFIEIYKSNAVGYDGVTDFTNANQKIRPDYLKEIRPTLEEHFDVKVLMIFRDPVRRLFSECCAFYENKWVQTDCKSAKEYFMSVLETGSITDSENYQLYFDNWRNSGYNIHPISMEKLYSGQKQELENFLGFEIDLYPTAYYPERGIDAPLIDGLRCQKSDTDVLSNSEYVYAKNKLKRHYRCEFL